MMYLLKKKVVLPAIASVFLFLGVSFKDDFFEIAKQIEIFTTLFKEINKNYVDPVNPAELMDKAIKEMLKNLDPYTNFYNEQDILIHKINNAGDANEIGATLFRKNDKLVVREPFKNYPADIAGLKAGDEITQIGDINIKDFKDDASNLLKGAKNTKIDITYLRQGKEQKTQITLSEVENKTVPYYGLIEPKIGYIVLTSFMQTASRETKIALEQLKRQGAEKIVLDLRNNPGGYIGEAINICNLFVPKDEVIVTTQSRIETNNLVYKTKTEPMDTKIPLVIIVNEKSASASEIVSGAMQDMDRAVIIGCRSFGKGLVQKPMELIYGTQMKVTISRYYTPSGRCIQALDYSHKDTKGEGTRTDAKNYNAFRTSKGRIVYDGGGIQPDIELENTKLSPLTNALLQNEYIFDYSTIYYYKNPTLGNQIPVITDEDYTEFKKFLKAGKFMFETETEKALEKTFAAAQKENLDTMISSEYKKLSEALTKTKEQQLDKYQNEIKNLIVDELIRRYQYQEGLYEYYIKHNFEIKRAVSILNDEKEYKKILKM